MSRPKIPAELKRRVLLEVGHRCAIHTYRHIDVEIHHIIPWVGCQEHKYENLIALCPNCHARADRDEIDRKSLRTYKANLRYAHDKFSQLEVDILFALHKGLEKAGLEFPSFVIILINRILEVEYVQVISSQNSVEILGMNVSPVYLFCLKLRGESSPFCHRNAPFNSIAIVSQSWFRQWT